MSRLLLLGAAGAGLALFFVARGKAVKAAAGVVPATPATAPGGLIPDPTPVPQPTGIAKPYSKPVPTSPGPRAPTEVLSAAIGGGATTSTSHPGYVFVNGHWERTRAPMAGLISGLGGFGRIARPRPSAMGFAGNYNRVAGQRRPINDYGSLAHQGRGSLGGKAK